MRLRIAPVVALNFVLAIMMLAIGLPQMLSAVLRLPSEVTIRTIKDGQPVTDAEDRDAAVRLEKVVGLSNATRSDLALVMLANNATPGSAIDKVAADHAVRQLLTYLDKAPDDQLAWENLALAEMRRGTSGAAIIPYKMSIELAPASVTNLLWRCRVGIDLYRLLDDEGRTTLARQFQMVMDPSLDQSIPENLVKLVVEKNAVDLARTFLASDANASRKFESLLALKH